MVNMEEMEFYRAATHSESPQDKTYYADFGLT
jgi:hypothetical protein